MAGWLIIFAVVVCVIAACAAPQVNPSFPATTRECQDALKRMAGDRKPLRRPLVLLGGYADPGLAVARVHRRMARVFDDDRIIHVAFIFCRDFDSCRRRAIEEVDRAFPSDDPDWTAEVDVVAISMGGLVARYAAAPPLKVGGPARRLRIARLLTISSPHRGASLADLPSLDGLAPSMRSGSAFLRYLDQQLEADGIEVYPYVRLGDVVVGPANAAPPGMTPWWVPNRTLQASHMQAQDDPRIVADIARRLRDEPPYTRLPAAPPP